MLPAGGPARPSVFAVDVLDVVLDIDGGTALACDYAKNMRG
jgi:hypothetical protein